MRVKHVWCSLDGDTAVVGHLVRSSYENEAGEKKAGIAVGDTIYEMAYRDPKDFDAEGSGMCYWNIVDEEGSNQG